MKRNHALKISWNQLFSYFFNKNVDLTEKMLIFRKNRDRAMYKTQSRLKSSWNQLFS